MARPMGSQDSLKIINLDMEAFTPNQATKNSQVFDGDDSDVYEGWNPTPPKGQDREEKDESDTWLDPNLKSTRAIPAPAKRSWEEPSTSQPRRRSITPSVLQPGRKRQPSGVLNDQKKALVSYESPDTPTARDGLGLRFLMSQMTTKEERAESHKEVIQAQEQMANQMTDAMTNIISSNRSEELKYKTQVARANMVVDLIHAGQSPESARTITREELPDM